MFPQIREQTCNLQCHGRLQHTNTGVWELTCDKLEENEVYNKKVNILPLDTQWLETVLVLASWWKASTMALNNFPCYYY